MSLIEIRVTAPDSKTADQIATRLVEERLAACVQQLPEISSTYVWEEKVERETEILLLIKTTGDAFTSVSEVILDIHPHDTPEILAVPVKDALASYAMWVHRTVIK